MLKSDADERRAEDLLSKTALARQFPLDAPTLAVYASLIAELDGDRYVLDDMELACKKIATEPRGEFQTQFPAAGEFLERIERERRLRVADSAKAACEERMAKLWAFAESERLKREAEWNERKQARAVSSAVR